jgi:hypothetical protein
MTSLSLIVCYFEWTDGNGAGFQEALTLYWPKPISLPKRTIEVVGV